MNLEYMVLELVLIYAGAALFATLFLFLRQPIILAYIALGMVIGPWGIGLVDEPAYIEEMAHIGIILLLFLLGVNMRPDRLLRIFRKTALLTIFTSTLFLALGLVMALLAGFSLKESTVIGAALMFSSTIVGLKLLPTTTLHHKYKGELMISVLLMQDILAIVLILFLGGVQTSHVMSAGLLLLLKLAVLGGAALLIVRFVITRLLFRFDVIHEYTFLLALGWGLAVAGIAKLAGLSYEIGAFVAGVSLAMAPSAPVIAEKLKPLRDFFLILFFFSIGAQFDFLVTQKVILAGVLFSLVVIAVKPLAFSWGFRLIGEKPQLGNELGFRLGQASEFSLLISYSALSAGVIQSSAAYLIQIVVLLTFVISTYLVMVKYPTPISGNSARFRD